MKNFFSWAFALIAFGLSIAFFMMEIMLGVPFKGSATIPLLLGINFAVLYPLTWLFGQYKKSLCILLIIVLSLFVTVIVAAVVKSGFGQPSFAGTLGIVGETWIAAFAIGYFGFGVHRLELE